MAAPTRMLLPYRSGLVGYWPLCEGGGIIAHDLSPMGNHGTLLPPASEPTWTVGKLGKALGFDGINDRLTISHSASINIGNGSWTISMWVNIASQAQHDFFVKQPTVGWVIIRTNQGGTKYSCQFYDGAKDAWVHYTSATYDNWELLTVEIDRNSNLLKIYVGTILKDSASIVGCANIGGSGDILLADGSLFSGGYCDVILDEVRVFNRALTAEEVLDEYFSAVRGWP